jgi:uroporphyrinogen-III synthase
MTLSLQGKTIALFEGRQLEDLAKLLEEEGAGVWRCPMLRIQDTEDKEPIIDWLRLLTDDRFNWIIFMTGEGIRRLKGFADRAEMGERFVAALSRTDILTRGPKPVQALKEIGLRPTLTASAPTTAGIIEILGPRDLRKMRIGVQLHAEQNQVLVQYLERAGAEPHVVRPYVYVEATNPEGIAALVRAAKLGEIHVVLFTSSPQVETLARIIDEQGLQQDWATALQQLLVAAVGPIVAGTLRRHGWRVDIWPEKGFVMKNLVQQIKRAWVE